MQISSESLHPIMQLRDDVLNFLEAVDPDPSSQLNKTGIKFARLLSELNQQYQMEYAIEHIESCYHSPEFIKPFIQS
jgi:hypothetical protein